jgi:hypothetical protein
MALNPQLFPNGMPVPFVNELFVLTRDGVEFEVDKIPGSVSSPSHHLLLLLYAIWITIKKNRSVLRLLLPYSSITDLIGGFAQRLAWVDFSLAVFLALEDALFWAGFSNLQMKTNLTVVHSMIGLFEISMFLKSMSERTGMVLESILLSLENYCQRCFHGLRGG